MMRTSAMRGGFIALSAVFVVTLLACGGSAPTAALATPASVAKAVEDPTVISAFISDSIQIDQLGSGALAPEDANLFVGLDPADSTLSANKPTGGPGDWIDWTDLEKARHTLMDVFPREDATAFPRSNECVKSAMVLSKMDLTYVAAANNVEYAYFAVQRSDNNGDAGYYWLFTKLQPEMVLGEAPCRADESRLLYDMSIGDVLIGGHFQPSASPLLKVWKAVANRLNVPATSAVNFQDGTLWELDETGVAAVAVNTTIADPGTFGAAGVKAVDDDGNVLPWIFAEAAVPVSVFTGESVCGATFWGSVITRSSGSGGTSPDLKDLNGPALFDFGSPSATAQLLPTCENKFLFELLTFTGLAGETVPEADRSCEWTFSEGSSSTACSDLATGIVALPGNYTGTLSVTEVSTGCSVEVTTEPVAVYAPLEAYGALTPTCDPGGVGFPSSFGFSGGYEGGSGDVTYAWAFSGGTVSPASSSAASGTVKVGAGNVLYSGALTVTDNRADLPGECVETYSGTVTPFEPIAVNLVRAAAAPSCPGMLSDAVTYDAVIAGGNGSYTQLWNGISCAGLSCVVDPSDSAFCTSATFSVTAGDDSGLCAAATSEEETYGKTTIVTATDLP